MERKSDEEAKGKPKKKDSKSNSLWPEAEF
jgi:hypothetical protein